MEERALSEAVLCFISLDVARVLNYLHQNHFILFTAPSAVPMCYFGDRVNIDEASCQIMELLTLCGRLRVASDAMIYSAPEG